jgi:hypothetical protein
VRTVGAVLTAMLKGSISNQSTVERQLVLARIKSCHILESDAKLEDALVIYVNHIEDVKAKVKKLEEELKEFKESQTEQELQSDSGSVDYDADDVEERDGGISGLR